MKNNKPHSHARRKHRHSESGQYYFLTTSIAGRRPIFSSTPHADVVLDAIRWLNSALLFVVEAAVVMPDHLHLVGQLNDRTLAKVMHSLKSCTAHSLAMAGVATPVWQRGFYDHALRGDEDFRVRVRYVLENPVRAGLVLQIEEYPHIIFPGWWDGSLD